MIVLTNVFTAESVVDLLFENGTREDLVAQAVATLEFDEEEVLVGVDKNLLYVLVQVGDAFGISKRCKKDKYDFNRGFTIALLRALGLSN